MPDTTQIKINPVKNTLIRDGVPSILKPFGSYALKAAATHGADKVIVADSPEFK